MKALVFLMIVLSVFSQINTDIYGLISLRAIEFLEPISIIRAGEYSLPMVVLWVALLLSHLALISLFFLTKKTYFQDLLTWIPLSFILVFIINSFLSFFLLIPFIIVWIVVLIKQRIKSKKLALVV